MTLYQASLFDTPREPVLAESSGWITGLLSGPLAVSLCVIAVALLGMLMLTGQLPLRRGGQVVVGCFLLLGGSVFVSGMVQWSGINDDVPAHGIVVPPATLSNSASPASYDPHAHASMRKD